MRGNVDVGHSRRSPFTTSQFFLSLFAALALCFGCAAQDQIASASLPNAPSQSQPSPNNAPPDNSRLTVPAGTRISLILNKLLNSHAVRTGDDFFAQVSAPVMVGDEVAIPAGSFIRGKVDKLTRHGTRGDLGMRSVSLVLGSSMVDLGGPINIRSDEWTAWHNPSGRRAGASILAFLGATGLGAAIGAATDRSHTTVLGGSSIPGLSVPPLTVTTNSHKGLAIGLMVGSAAGGVAAGVLATSGRDFYLDQGTTLEMTLPNPVSVTRAQISEGASSAPPITVTRPRRPGPGQGNNPPVGFPGNTPATGPASCSAGEEWCMGSCKSTIDFVNDNHNCGRCGNSCSINESCTGGSCSCALGYTSCMGSCVSDSSFISDNNNCGSCGHSCSFNESCTGGMCMKRP